MEETENTNVVSFKDFSRVEMKIGTIKSVSDHPGADKLYVLLVDLGHEQVQIVAGIKKHYNPEQLLEKQVVIVTNLEPKVLRGIRSQGMLLAASSEGIISVLSPDRDVPPGSSVH